MKRVFGIVEAVFDASYLVAALVLGLTLLLNGSVHSSAYVLAGLMALILAFGDAFHSLPRMAVIMTHDEERLRPALGRGKQITSVTMTVFYLILWQIGLMIFSPGICPVWSCLIYFLAAVRIFICFMPQNRWQERFPPVTWAIFRNIPFFLLGIGVAFLFFFRRETVKGVRFMWLAIALSFACYLPVVLWSNKRPAIGMLMLPKICAYLWMLVMCLSL